MRVFLAVIITIAVLIAGAAGVGYTYLKLHHFSARVKPSHFETSLARMVRRVSEPDKYHDLANPVPATPDAIAEGRHHYSQMCVVCHGSDGRGGTETGEGLYPPMPDLTAKGTQSMTDGDLYNSVKNGIPFSGMPAWNEEEATYWKIVDFLRHMPQMTAAEAAEVQKMSGLSVEHE